jgi:Fe2+ transport system protein FeoA
MSKRDPLVTSLANLKPGESGTIVDIDNTDVQSQLIRLGLDKGKVVRCMTRIPSGPTVIMSGGMELALGRDLSRHIMVQRAAS